MDLAVDKCESLWLVHYDRQDGPVRSMTHDQAVAKLDR